MAPDPSAKKTQSWKNHTKMKGYRRIEEKGYATTRRAHYPYDLRRPTLSIIRMEYMSFGGTVTMFLRVVAPQTPETIDGF